MRWLAIVVTLGTVLGCETTEAVAVAVKQDVARTTAPVSLPRLKAETVLPESFARRIPPAKVTSNVVVPRDMVAISEVVRPRAEVRTGPGVQFDLTDAVLPQGRRVLVFAKVGVWRQVVVPGMWQKGWVHHQALGPTKLNHKAVTIDASKLPTVLAMRDIESARAFPSGAPLKVSIPTGAIFRSLRMSDGETLVWLAETDSVMWMSRKDVK